MKPEVGRNQHSSVANGNLPKTSKSSNQRAYTLSRLQRERPDLFELVKVRAERGVSLLEEERPWVAPRPISEGGEQVYAYLQHREFEQHFL